MDPTTLLKDVKTLDDYISITHDLTHKYKSLNIQYNISSVFALKKLRSLEIEFFNKCDDSGAAFLLFQRMQALPPSKTWNILGKELVYLIQYWLDAVRKHLITHHPHWWSFLKHLLDFIKKIKLKHEVLNNVLVSETSESLLDLATSNRLTSDQRYEILHTFNLFCAESSREIRLSMRPQLEHYFIKLSSILSTCGHVPSQYAITEVLLRWLQPRHDQAVRREAAARWFPENLYSRTTVQLFLERPWLNFFQDARDFLNSHNETGDQVTSLVCKKLSVGKVVLISGSERRQTWLDVNQEERCLTVLLEPRVLEAVDPGRNYCSALLITSDNTTEAQLYRESVELTISVTTVSPPQLVPAEPLFSADDTRVTIVVSSRSNLVGLDNALRAVFTDKYQVLLDFNNVVSLSPPAPYPVRRFTNSDEETRFSHPAKDVKRRKKSGYIVRPKNWQSPSSVSTSSLAQLHDKLAALPHYKFDKEPVSVCAQPVLSSVIELNETYDKTSLDSHSTLRLSRPNGVCKRSNKNKKSQSDTEVKDTIITTDLSDGTRKQPFVNDYSKNSQSDSDVNVPSKTNFFVEDERSNSCLFVATIGTADQSVINATLERMPNDSDNIIELLVEESLHAKDNERIESGIIADVAKETRYFEFSEAIETTPHGEIVKTKPKNQKPNCTIVSKSTSDESTTEAINDTQISYVSVRKKNLVRNKSRQDNNIEKETNYLTSIQAVEDFFSQHVQTNQAGNVIISPTLAKKINETSSDSSDDFDQYLISNNFNMNEEELAHDVDIIDCLNNIVDQVCNDFDKCTELLNRETEQEILNIANDIDKGPLEEIGNTIQDACKEDSVKNKTKNTRTKQKSVKLTYKTGPKKQNAKPKNVKSKLILEPTQMTPIIEATNEVTDESVIKNTSCEPKLDKETPLTRRKRKLYSPNNYQMTAENKQEDELVMVQMMKPVETLSNEDDDVALSELLERRSNPVTPISTATCYKELEAERKKYKRTRIRRSKNRPESPVSPKTKKLNDVFDQLKVTNESEEKITLADKQCKDKDYAIYNFTSDSEDEDFIKKKIEVRKRTSTTTVDSGNSVLSLRRGRTVKKVDKSTDKDVKTEEKPSKRKKTVKRKNTKAKPKVNICKELRDERMRASTTDVFNTSLIVGEPINNENKDPDPIINPPEIENIDEIQPSEVFTVKRKTKKEEKATKTEKVKALEILKDKDEDGTLSPLPGLQVETVNAKPDKDEFPTENMVQKFQKIYQDGPDACINETNTTHNLLSDFERTNYNLNNMEDFNEVQDNGEDNTKNKSNRLEEIDPEINRDAKSDIDSNKSSKKNSKSQLRLKNRNRCSQIETPDSVRQSKDNKFNSTINTRVTDIEEIDCSFIAEGDSKIEGAFKGKKVILKLKKEKAFQIDEHAKTYNTSEICTENKSFAKSKKPNTDKSNSMKNKPAQIINLDLTDTKSERSIATDGITAHGVSSQTPPSPTRLNERVLIPREVEDLDQCIQDYYVKLRNEVNRREQSFSKNSDNSSNSNRNRSPVVLIKRMSDEELSKHLSRTTSKEETTLCDNEIRRYLPSSKDSESEVYQSAKESSKEKRSPVFRRSSHDISKWLPSVRATNSDHESVKSIESEEKVSSQIKTKSQGTKEKDGNYKSLITPIDLFDAFIPFKQTQRSCNEVKILSFKNSTPESKKKEKPTENTKYNLRKQRTEKECSIPFKKDSTPYSESSRSCKDDSKISRTVKRKPEKETKEYKRRKLEETDSEIIAITESGPSVSSVDDWFRRNVPTSSREDTLDLSIRDTMQNVMEKLDTTLEEIHQNTSKLFLHLFVDTQKQLLEHKEEQRELKRVTAMNILKGVSKLIDAKFSELDQRAQEKSDKFMEDLKRRASEFLREDCKKKRVMVTILKEDVHEVIQYLDKRHK